MQEITLDYLWDNDCGQCCLDCFLEFDRCLCSCINNNVRCIKCKTARYMEGEENDRRKKNNKQ